jgi:hypothetical protein
VASYIEITNPVHGGAGWEFGTCLWSPVTNKGGSKSWELMREIATGDIVYHLLKDRPGAGYFLVGASRAAAPAQVITSSIFLPPPRLSLSSGTVHSSA